jgi:hypothetical protein
MRVAVLADIHGNLPALDAVLRRTPYDTEALAAFSETAGQQAAAR